MYFGGNTFDCTKAKSPPCLPIYSNHAIKRIGSSDFLYNNMKLRI